MTDFYRFPAMADYQYFTRNHQDKKIRSEVEEMHEARIALDLYEPYERKWILRRNEYGIELMDIIHAVETSLRMEFTDKEIDELHRAVEDKNRERGYYDS